VYTKGTETKVKFSKAEMEKISKGKMIFQEYNCSACHQVYGLGGYLGPDLTTVYSDKHRGETYTKAMLTAGGSRMPDFHLNPAQVEAVAAYLKYIDSVAATQNTTE
jgi:nitric oxide reductase subunit C